MKKKPHDYAITRLVTFKGRGKIIGGGYPGILSHTKVLNLIILYCYTILKISYIIHRCGNYVISYL